jgi:FkbM family methyltransferase
MSPTRRTLAAVSRRWGRPELLATFYPDARQALREEVALTAILASALRSDGMYVDVGTNKGQVLREALRLAPRGRHLAFEPIPAVADELARAYPSVECRQLALGARSEEAQFCHFKKLEGWSGLRRSPLVSDERGDPEYITVTVSTLDEQLGEHTPCVVKIDVEGAELGVIEGGRELLTRAKPVLIVEHVAAAAALYGAESGALWDLLGELGYETLSITGDGPFARQAFAANTTVVNWLARPMSASG